MKISWVEKFIYPGIDLEHWDVVGCLPQKKKGDAVFLLHKKSGGRFSWCIKHLGDNGRYFKSFGDMADYFSQRYGISLDKIELKRLSEEYRQYSLGELSTLQSKASAK